MRIIKITMVLILLLLSTSNAQQLKLNITSLKNIYLKGEPIQISIGVKNEGGKNIDGNFHGTMELKLINDSGKELEYIGPSVDSFSPITDILESNEEVYNIIEVNRYYGKLFNLAYYDHYLDTGNYTLQVIFSHHIQKPISEQVSFQVENPYDEELIVYNIFIDIIEGEVKGKYSANEVAQKLVQLHKTYPNSVYSTNILSLLDAVYDISLGEHDKAVKIREELVMKYPSVKAWWALEAVLKRKKSKSDKIEYVKELLINNKGTIMEKLYEQKLQNLEKK